MATMGTTPDPRPTKVRYFVLVWFCSAAILAYVHRNAIGVASEKIQADLQLTDRETGLLLGAFFWGYAVLQIPSGWLGNFWGTRKGLTIFVTCWSLATAWTGLAAGFVALLAARFVNGVAQAGLFPCCANSISKWFPESQRAMPNGFLTSAMSVGSVVAAALVGFLLDEDSAGWRWQTIFIVLGLPGILWALAFWFWFRDLPEDHPSVNESELSIIREQKADEGETAARPAADPTAATPWLAIASSPRMHLICGQQFFRAAGYIFFVSWFPRYLREIHDVSLEQAGLLTSMPLLGAVLGGVTGGKVSDVIQKKTGNRRLSRQLIGALSQYLCAAAIFAAYFLADPIAAVFVISIGTFIFAFGGSSAYTVTIDLAGNHVATVFSFMNMSGNVGAAVCPIVIGYLVDEAYVGLDWQYVLVVFAGIFLTAGICWTFLNPNGTIFDRPNDDKAVKS